MSFYSSLSPPFPLIFLISFSSLEKFPKRSWNHLIPLQGENGMESKGKKGNQMEGNPKGRKVCSTFFSSSHFIMAYELLICTKKSSCTVDAASQWWWNEQMMVYFQLMLQKCSFIIVKCLLMKVKWVLDHTLISPSLTSISTSLRGISPSLTSISPALTTIIKKLHRKKLHRLLYLLVLPGAGGAVPGGAGRPWPAPGRAPAPRGSPPPRHAHPCTPGQAEKRFWNKTGVYILQINVISFLKQVNIISV